MGALASSSSRASGSPSTATAATGNEVPLREDLADDLRHWLAEKLSRAQDKARQCGKPIPVRLPPDTPVFTVPGALVKILDRDLVLAGLARRVKVGAIGASTSGTSSAAPSTFTLCGTPSGRCSAKVG